ncbi:MAG: SDR family oxidoreductase [Acidobacteriota bacterium]
MMMKKTALVTGASSGIGLELSRLLAADGHNLVLVARNKARLDEIAQDLRGRHGVEVAVMAADLSDPVSARELAAALDARSIEVDVLVNNAGFGMHGVFAEADVDQLLGMLHVNMTSLTYLTRLILPQMIARGTGSVLNVGSTGSFGPCPLMAVYCATKAYVLSFSEALAEELRGTGVSVTALCPGVTETGFQARAKVEKIRMTQTPMMSAREVAEAGYRAMKQRRALTVPGIANRLLVFSWRLVPRSLGTWVAHKIMAPVAS